MNTEEIKNDKQLRPYFLTFIAKNFVLGLSDTFKVNHADHSKFQKEFYDAQYQLCEQLRAKVTEEEIYPVIEEVSSYYLRAVGHVTFENYR